MELTRIQKFVNEHVDASLPAENQTLILGSDMDLMGGGSNTKCTNKDSGVCENSKNGTCTNSLGECDNSSNKSCLSGANPNRNC